MSDNGYLYIVIDDTIYRRWIRPVPNEIETRLHSDSFKKNGFLCWFSFDFNPKIKHCGGGGNGLLTKCRQCQAQIACREAFSMWSKRGRYK